MANSPLENIYNRIKEAGGYHPMTANTFADWSLEAGDVVNVSRDGRTYNVPVHTSKLKWNGKQEVEIETTGKRERDSIAKVSQQKYGGRGASGLRNGQGMYDEAYDMYGNVSRLWNTAQGLYHEVYDSDGNMARLAATAKGLYHEVYDTDGNVARLAATAKGLYHEVYDSEGRVGRLQATTRGLYHEIYDTDGNVARLAATAKGLYHEVYDSEGRVGKLELTAQGLKHEVEGHDGRISRVTNTVDGFKAYLHGVTDEDGHLTEASIATALDDEGKAGARIDGAWVQIGSKGTATTVITSQQTTIDSQQTTINGILHAGYITANDITTTLLKDKIGEIDLLNVNAIAAASGGAYCYLSEFKGNNYKVNIEGGAGSVSTRDLCDGVYDIGLSYNSSTGVYTLQKKAIKESNWTNVGTFSRAVSLSGEWNGGTYSVSAKSGTISGTAPRETLSVASGITSSKPPTIDANYPKTAIVPIKVYSYANGSSERKDTGYSGNAQCDMSALLETETFTANGTFPHSSGKLGYNTVTVNVTPALTGTWAGSSATELSRAYTVSDSNSSASLPVEISTTASSGSGATFYIHATSKQSGTSTFISRTRQPLYLKVSGQNVSVYDNSAGTGTAYATATVPSSKPSLSGAWSNGKFSVTASPSGSISGTAPSATAYAESNGNPTKVESAKTGIIVPYKISSVVNSGGTESTKTGVYTGNIVYNVSSLLQPTVSVTPGASAVEVTPDNAYVGLSKVTVKRFVPDLNGAWDSQAATVESRTFTVEETKTGADLSLALTTLVVAGSTNFKVRIGSKQGSATAYTPKTTTTFYLVEDSDCTVSVCNSTASTRTTYASKKITPKLTGTWEGSVATNAERTYTVTETKSGVASSIAFTAVPATGSDNMFYMRVGSKQAGASSFTNRTRTPMYLSATGLTVTVHDNDSGSGTAYATILTKPLASDIGVGSEGWYGESGTLPSATTLSNLGSIINNNHRGYAYFTVSAGKTNKRYRIPIN